ncbi:MAG: ROK family protein [Candidatus Limiplasma sp.]|nr:ROK family protein [Candidatus Limiplasma sp.]
MDSLKIIAPLDKAFTPIYRSLCDLQARSEKENGPTLRIALERNDGLTAVRDMRLLPETPENDALNLTLAERMIKSMIWVYGGFRVTVAGSRKVYEGVKDQYRVGSKREFDAQFMARVYEHDFEVLYAASPADAPAQKDASSPIGRHLDGCRIGFDAGGSDRKVSAVIDGQSVYSEEVVWFPKTTADPAYHFDGIVSAMKTAASKMPRVDAIGVSSAGVYINNHTMKASLFLKVPQDDYDKYVKDIYIRAAKEIGDVPLVVCNDGDVTALAGAMSLGVDGILGIAMGTSEAGGYVDTKGNITGWLNELAFVPCDLAPDAMVDEWSGDRGCGVKYFSQDAVIKLAPAAGIHLDESLSPAEKLKVVQAEMEKGNPEAAKIYETIGVYLGYTLAFYAMFYDINHVLLMGRVTSGKGGDIVLAKAQEVLRAEYPQLKIQVNLPDEKSRRVGQSVAAASLPSLQG